MVTRLLELWENSTTAFLAAAAACLYLVWLAVQLSVVDIRTHTLPDRLVLPAYPVAGVLLLVAAVAGGMPALAGAAAAGALAMAALYWVLWAVQPAGIGFGDVKLAGVLGLFLGFLGWQHVVLGTAAGFVVGGLWGIALIVSRRGTAKSAIPFGPSMLAGTLATMLLLPV
ncbi:leader peptidase (prepilin peptidase)/N-methyltransferase [Arthrobacter stackebrandtii]|uniref:Leader peptidase (Prepilin peptidase)/N-methyltransferase n=1 Tax=Arthrobacter stackebrandtii TaxID=272161 RepID=A0ABS4YS55_9MICC|nr:A24 family peptidase [Arthrobacter stackebrandtii]MBP2411626.1 leader peptidase (prepilin peptidase)/N-methyltransferase [Arthrobacter stackebrandtii]PYG99296.1 prepilin peptidase [Arthrobacter stackebrandtii]